MKTSNEKITYRHMEKQEKSLPRNMPLRKKPALGKAFALKKYSLEKYSIKNYMEYAYTIKCPHWNSCAQISLYNRQFFPRVLIVVYCDLELSLRIHFYLNDKTF